ncbi:hypothetical protein Tco_0178865 [Tanacetum coccineum]
MGDPGSHVLFPWDIFEFQKDIRDEIAASKRKSDLDSSSTQVDDDDDGNKKKIVVSKLKLNSKAAKHQASKRTVDPKLNPNTLVKPKSKEAESSRLITETCFVVKAHEVLPWIHQMHCTDPGDDESVGRTLNRSMDSDKYLEGQSMQRPPLFESDHFIYWKNRFETYVKAKDLDLWHIILNGDFPPVAKNEVTQVLEVVPFEEQSDDLKKKLAKNNEAKMVLYNALPKKEYERIFMCKTAKDIWQSLLITHQGNSQVKDNKIDLLVQQYEQFTILEEESIDSGFARFNTIITSLKALDEGFSSKNYVRKFLRALHPKWRAKVTSIEESKCIIQVHKQF